MLALAAVAAVIIVAVYIIAWVTGMAALIAVEKAIEAAFSGSQKFWLGVIGLFVAGYLLLSYAYDKFSTAVSSVATDTVQTLQQPDKRSKAFSDVEETARDAAREALDFLGVKPPAPKERPATPP
jgi:hypothetical protein